MNKLCECGCGKEVINESNRFLNGHYWNGKKLSNRHKLHLVQNHKGFLGKTLSEESKLKITKSKIGKTYSENTKLKMSKSHKGKKFSKDHILKILEGRKGYKHSSKTKLKISESNKGKKLSDKTKLKISAATLGKKRSTEIKLKMSEISTGRKHTKISRLKISNFFKGKKLSDNHKLKLSIAAIKHLEKTAFNNGPMFPGIGKNEIPILDKLENSTGVKLLRNDHDLALKIGKFCDGYNPQFNLPVEVLENDHFRPNGELSKYDQDREVLIASRLACMIYYIPEKEFLNNPEKEIQRFKDFLELLKN